MYGRRVTDEAPSGSGGHRTTGVRSHNPRHSQTDHDRTTATMTSQPVTVERTRSRSSVSMFRHCVKYGWLGASVMPACSDRARWSDTSVTEAWRPTAGQARVCSSKKPCGDSSYGCRKEVLRLRGLQGGRCCLALTVGSVSRGIVPKLRHFNRLSKTNNRWSWRNWGTIPRGTDPTVSAMAPKQTPRQLPPVISQPRTATRSA